MIIHITRERFLVKNVFCIKLKLPEWAQMLVIEEVAHRFRLHTISLQHLLYRVH